MPGPNKAGRFDIAAIVRDHRKTLESTHWLSPQQKRVLTDIALCRTAILGGHLDKCRNCDYERPSYNSCRNRHCPKCQALAQEKWIAERQQRMLDVKHFHVVFTLPAELRPLAAFAKDSVYGVLFRAASSTLLEFGERRLSATIGATLVLHTWARDLSFHPHVHAIVTGGGLSTDGTQWHSVRRAFLFPVKAMSRVFRGKMIDELKRAYDDNEFAKFCDSLARCASSRAGFSNFHRADIHNALQLVGSLALQPFSNDARALVSFFSTTRPSCNSNAAPARLAMSPLAQTASHALKSAAETLAICSSV